MSGRLIIGLGNRLRADDGAGPAVAEAVKAGCPRDTEVIVTAEAGLDLLTQWEERPVVLVIDAVRSKAIPGTLHRFDAHLEPVPVSVFGRSTHTVSLAETIALARALGQMPTSLVLYGIEASDFSLGGPMSEAVRQAIPKLAEKILAELRLGLPARDKM